MLIADCWEHIFDYLSFKDIILMGQTCKRMNRMCGYYVREYYPKLKFELIWREICFENVRIQPVFYPFISLLRLKDKSELDFFSNGEIFDALKMIFFIFTHLLKLKLKACKMRWKMLKLFIYSIVKLLVIFLNSSHDIVQNWSN